jgi:hypothetical protein
LRMIHGRSIRFLVDIDRKILYTIYDVLYHVAYKLWYLIPYTPRQILTSTYDRPECSCATETELYIAPQPRVAFFCLEQR